MMDASDDTPEGRLPAAGLADEPDHLALADREVDAVDGMDGLLAVLGAEQVGEFRGGVEWLGEALRDAFEGEDRRAHAATPARFSGWWQRTPRSPGNGVTSGALARQSACA